MSFKLLPNTVYATVPTQISIAIIQPVGGPIRMFGSNIVKYDGTNGKRRIIVPKFEELILLWDDDTLAPDCLHQLTSMSSWIAFDVPGGEKDVEAWITHGINEKITPIDYVILNKDQPL